VERNRSGAGESHVSGERESKKRADRSSEREVAERERSG